MKKFGSVFGVLLLWLALCGFTGFSPYPGGGGGGSTLGGTLTDGKWCTYNSSTGKIDCDEDAPEGSGDVTSVGNCDAGACYDGTSDGGSYIRLFDSGSAYDSITGGVRTFTFASSISDVENLVLTLGNNDNSLTLSSGTGATGLTLSSLGLTVGGTLALGTNSLTMTGSIGATGSRVTKGWFTDLEITNLPTVNGGTLATALSLGTMAAETATNYVTKATLDAYSILTADTDNTPVATTLDASTLLGRGASGGIAKITLGTGLSMGGAAALTLDADLSTIAGLTYTRGDLLVGGESAWTDLALGSANTVVYSDGTDVKYGTVTSAMITNDTITTTDIAAALTFAEGDLIDLSGITMSAGVDEGLALPTFADVAPANEKYYVAYDASNNALMVRESGGWVNVGASAAAPTTAHYVVTSASGNLSEESVVTEGLAIDISDAGGDGGALTFAFDPTELTGNRTWAAGGAASIVWTWDNSGSTDPTLTFGDGLITSNSSVTVATGKNITVGTTQWNSSDEIDGTKIKDADLGDIVVSEAGAWTIDSGVVTAAKLASADFGPFTNSAGTITMDADSINDTHIDWGTGTNQVSLDDVTDGSSYEKVAAADVSSGHVINFYDSDGSSYLTITGLASTTRAMTVPDSAFTVSGINIAQNISGTWEIQDGVNLNFGNDADWGISYDETTNDQLLWTTAKTAAASASEPMFKILVDSGGSGMTADQYIFGIYKSTTRLFSLDEDGDVYIAGSITTQQATDPGIVFDETTASDTDYWFAINADQEGDNDDYLEIGTGTVKGTGTVFQLNPTGALTLSSTIKATSLILEGGTYDITIDADTPTANTTYTWPNSPPGSSGYALVSTTGGVMSWAEITATAGGSNTYVQYNASGTLGGESSFTYDATNNTLSITQAASNPTLQVGDGTYSWGHTPQVGIEGILEVDGAVYADNAVLVGSYVAVGSDPADAGAIRLANGAAIAWEDATELTLTHVDNTGLLLNAAHQLQFRDSAIYIASLNDGYLDIEADTAIRMLGPVDMGANALDCDSNTVTLSTLQGTINQTSGTFTSGGIVLGDSSPDGDGEFGYASNAFTWFANSESAVITASANLWTFSSGSSALFAFTPSVNFTGGLTLDDGSGASPGLTFQDETNETAAFSKVDAGYLTITTVAGDGVQVLVGNLKVGDGSPGQTLDGEDFYVNGLVEIDGMLYADGGMTSTKVNAATGGADVITLSGTLGAMDGADDYVRGVYVNWTNADHSNGNAYGIHVANITGDANATERALMIGTGWDHGLYSGSPLYVGDGTNGLTVSAIGAQSFAGTATFSASGATSSVPWVTGSGTASNTAEGTAYWETDTDMLTIGDGATGISLDFTANAVYTFPAASGTLATNTSTATLNFGGATLEIPNSDDPDLTVTGQISWDTDGWLRTTSDDGTTQKAIPVQEEIHVTVYKPQDLDDAQRDHFWIWSNESGMSFIVTGWKAWSTSDDTTLTIYEEDADGQNDATVDAVEIATNGTGLYYASDSTITAGTIETGHLLYLDFDNTDAPAMVKITIYGYYNGNVN